MSPSAKIAGVAALSGMMLAIVIAGAAMPGPPAPAAAAASPAAITPDPLARELDRCATLTMPDAGCEAAWSANRRRFFGDEAARP